MRYWTVATCFAVAFSSSAHAADKWAVQPIQTGAATARYVQGVPTIELEMEKGIARVTALPLDHGSLSFTVAVYNDSDLPSNFGIENISLTSARDVVSVLSKDELVKKAKNRAFWSQFGLALAGGVAAGSAASQRNVYTSRFVTPRGTYRSYFTAPSAAGQWQAAGITAATVGGIALIQLQLDRTITALGDEIVQTTTIDPGESYAGRIVMKKFDPGKLPAQVTIQLSWNGEVYPFTYQIAKPGTIAPSFTNLGRAASMRERRPRTPQPVSDVANSSSSNASNSIRTISPTRGLSNLRVRCDTCRN